MAGHFKVSKVTDLKNLKVGDILQESDFSCITDDNKFLQMEYVDEAETLEKYEVKPGVWKLVKTNVGLRLVKSEFSKDKILESFVHTQELETKIDCFFRNLEEYKALGIETPKRAALLWGSPGTGKTAAAIHCADKYVKQFNDVAVVIWHTDALDPFEVKTFVQTFEYKGVNKLIMVMEDIGGVEVDQTRMKSTSSLLSLLDNKEKTFTVPVFIVATTNFPENFLGNLTNRPQRFDDKIHMGNPSGNERKELLRFFLQNFVEKYSKDDIDDVCHEVSKEKYSDFSIAHLQDVIVRSRIYEKDLFKCLTEIHQDIELFKKNFEKNKGRLGITFEED